MMWHNLLFFKCLQTIFVVVGNYRTHPEQPPIPDVIHSQQPNPRNAV